MLVAQNSLGPVCPVPLTVRGNDVELELGVSAVRPAACPRPAHPKTPYRLQPLFCVNISHYPKYVRSKFPPSSYSGRKATVISHFECRPRPPGELSWELAVTVRPPRASSAGSRGRFRVRPLPRPAAFNISRRRDMLLCRSLRYRTVAASAAAPARRRGQGSLR